MTTEAGFPLGEMLGLVIDDTGDGVASGRVQVDHTHHNPHGAVHGLVVFGVLDTLMGSATMSVLPEGERCATSDLHIRYHAPVTEGELRAIARIAHRGRRVFTLHGEACDAQGALVATATASFIRIGEAT